METVEQLQATEGDCIRRFRAKSQRIQAAHPDLSQSICFARAVEGMPKTAATYQYTRGRLQLMGVAALPLR